MVRLTEQANQSHTPLEHVFGVVKIPGARGRNQNIFVGWDTNGFPAFTKNNRLLTRNANSMLGGNGVMEFPFEVAQAGYTPQALEFAEMGQSTDNPDEGNQFTEDVLSISCTDGKGSVKFVEVEELDLLEGILRGQIDWNIGGVQSYSLMIPDEHTETLHFVLFSPGNEPSNELAYRTFLLKVIKTLTTLDRNQIPPDQKGYMDVLTAVVKNLDEKAKAKKAEKTPLEKIAADLGILNEAEVGRSNQFAYLNVIQLRYIIGKFHEVVTQSFADGKQS